MLYVSKEIETGPPNFPENICTRPKRLSSLLFPPSYIVKGYKVRMYVCVGC